MKAVVALAGFGTRLLPLTKAQPKAMLSVADRPLVHYIVEEIVNSGIKEIIFIINRRDNSIKRYFARDKNLEKVLKSTGKDELARQLKKISKMAKFHFVYQPKPLGTGDAILMVKRLIGNKHFALLYGDDLIDCVTPCLKQLVNVYKKYRGSVIAVRKVPHRDVYRWGIIDGKKIGDRNYRLSNIIEKPKIEEAPTNLSIIGRYILSPQIFKNLSLLKRRQSFTTGKKELYVTDGIKMLLDHRCPVYACEFKGQRFDGGSHKGLVEATIFYSRKHNII
ncbi:MAG: UTP--glucose-1-phosphate uridylyltransferase [Patescibacteria group bacterium]|nr:UTP--glucose-1-phosphate uridylyltransferase [Patescibacteria group bacterium]MDD5121205.1 UTP--glucose-1-phosphate uridylyltransferase [Patescibacteria group bacterium]MDD5221766.1 UTP--glucose-1-phosphate uridylyltransferase [Patescibacteria group bacterium]MDD5395876.1 UTP--glucose-1-phosphate uridylyltransferase [Patescibacteria group bacterium]